jgi:hypothetical protein
MDGNSEASPLKLPYSCGDSLDVENLPQYWCEFAWSREIGEWILADDSIPEDWHCKPPNYDGSENEVVYLFPCPNTPPDPNSDPDPGPGSTDPLRKLPWPSKAIKMQGLSQRPPTPPDATTSSG